MLCRSLDARHAEFIEEMRSSKNPQATNLQFAIAFSIIALMGAAAYYAATGKVKIQ